MRKINKRLGNLLSVVCSAPPPSGKYLLDCYMGRCVRGEYSNTITTRTAQDANTFVMEIIEDGEDTTNARGDV